jgi:hypothetical protein
MIQIDIDADLNMVDDDGRNIARRPPNASGLRVGGVAIAGRPGLWSWVVVDAVTADSVVFRQISAREAAMFGDLAVPPPKA